MDSLQVPAMANPVGLALKRPRQRAPADIISMGMRTILPCIPGGLAFFEGEDESSIAPQGQMRAAKTVVSGRANKRPASEANTLGIFEIPSASG